MATSTFVIDCPECKAKVAATEMGRAERTYVDKEIGEPVGHRLHIGSCQRCGSLLAGESEQISFDGYNADEDEWSNIVRIYPKPPKTFISNHIPHVVKESLLEADLSLEAGANIAACAMLGRALEAVCRDILDPEKKATGKRGEKSPRRRKIMLAEGIKKLREQKVIDDRLYEWSQQLHAFRNLAAHPEDTTISRQDSEDLQIFVYAIVDYIYDLADRYDEFKFRAEKQRKRKRT